MNMNLPGPLENPETLNELIGERQAEQQLEAEEAQPPIAQRIAEDRDARLAGYKSPVRRLIERLRPTKA